MEEGLAGGWGLTLNQCHKETEAGRGGVAGGTGGGRGSGWWQ